MSALRTLQRGLTGGGFLGWFRSYASDRTTQAQRVAVEALAAVRLPDEAGENEDGVWSLFWDARRIWVEIARDGTIELLLRTGEADTFTVRDADADSVGSELRARCPT